MIELFVGDALFGGSSHYYGELSLLSQIILASIFIDAIVILVMTVLSLISLVMSGAPFIATSKSLTRKIVALAGIQPGEQIYDLGCGDGSFLIEAQKKYGVLAVGIRNIAAGLRLGQADRLVEAGGCRQTTCKF